LLSSYRQLMRCSLAERSGDQWLSAPEQQVVPDFFDAVFWSAVASD
jgi:hypothetical protein